MSSSPKILFIQTAFVGDLLLSIPTLRAIREENPSAKLTLLCRKGLGEFMRSAGVVDEVVEADKSSRDQWASVEQKLKSVFWDIIYCPHQSTRSLLLVRNLRAARKVGYRSLLGKFIFDQSFERPMHLPEALRQQALLDSKRTRELFSFEKISNQNIYRRLPKLKDRKNLALTENLKAVPLSASMELPSLKSAKQKLIIIAPGSVWNTKKWTEQGFSEVGAHYASQGKAIQLVGSPDERAICERVQSLILSLAPNARVINTAGELTLWQSAQAMAQAELVFTNDSGAMHMAACAGTASVTVFGPTVLEQGYRPWQTRSKVVHTVLSCRPCGKHGARKCPIGTHECMKLVSSKSVIEAAQSLV